MLHSLQCSFSVGPNIQKISLMAMAAARPGLLVSSSVTSRLMQLFGQRSQRELRVRPLLHSISSSSSPWIEQLIHIRARSLRWHQTGYSSPPGGLKLQKSDCHTMPVRTFSKSCFAMSRSRRRIPRRLQRASKETVIGEETVSYLERHEDLKLSDSTEIIGSKRPVKDVGRDPGLDGTFIIQSSHERPQITQSLHMNTVSQENGSFNDAETYQRTPVASMRSNNFPDSKQAWHEESRAFTPRYDNERPEVFAPHQRTNPFGRGGKDKYENTAEQRKGSSKRGFLDRHQQQNKVKGHRSRVNNPGWTQGEETTAYGAAGDEVEVTEVETVSADLLETDSPEYSSRKSKAEGWRKHQNQENKKSSVHKKAKEELMIPRGHDLLYGISPCLLALQNARREVHQLYVTSAFQKSERSEVKEILALVEERGLRMWTTNRRVLDKFSEQRPHQGVCMETSRLYFSSVQEKENEDVEVGPVSASTIRLVLDQIKDPMNLGALLRSAYFLGIDKVIVSKKNCCSLTPVVSKASSGVMEVMPVYATPNIASYLQIEKEKGWSIVGASVGTSMSSGEVIPCHKYNQTAPLLLVVGNEGFGLSSEISDQCSEFISIPAGRQLHAGIDSLNVSVATGILLHSLLGQK